MSQIKFKNKTTALGRNGTSICTGLVFYSYQRIDENNKQFNVLELSPLNSKGDTTRCLIEIDMEAIPELINQLQFFYDTANKSTGNSTVQGQPGSQPV